MLQDKIKIEGSEIFYTSMGAENVNKMIFIHDNPGSSTDLHSANIKALAKNFHIVAFDRAGHGESDFKKIDFFTPNEKEAGFYLKKNIETQTDIKKASNDLLKKGIKNIVITLGAKGVYFANSKENYFIDAFKLKKKVFIDVENVLRFKRV